MIHDVQAFLRNTGAKVLLLFETANNFEVIICTVKENRLSLHDGAQRQLKN